MFQFFKTHLERVFWVSLGLWLALGLARLGWIASSTEIGFELLRQGWFDATVGIARGRRPLIADGSPVEQAEFWLAESERVLARHPQDAEMAAAAAMILNLQTLRIGQTSLRHDPIDDSSLRDLAARCGRMRIRYIERATELEPTNVQWWRLRALMVAKEMFANRMDSSIEPSQPNAAQGFLKCGENDLDNGLYLHLDALRLWDNSTDWINSEDFATFSLKVTDSRQFELGKEQFQKAMKKPFLRIPDAEQKSIAKFLRASDILPFDRAVAMQQHHSNHHLASILHTWQIQRRRVWAANWDGKIDEALAIHKDLERFVDQIDCPNLPFIKANFGDRHTKPMLVDLAAEHPAAFSEDEQEKNREAAIEGLIRMTVLAEADRAVAMKRGYLPYLNSFEGGFALNGSSLNKVCALVARPLPRLSFLLCVVGITAMVLVRTTAKEDGSLAIGALPQSFALLFVLTALVALYALAPAEIIQRKTQNWFFTLLILAAPLVLPLTIAWYWLHGRRYQFTLRFAFIMTLMSCLILGLVVTSTRPDTWTFSSLPFEIGVDAMDWDGKRVNTIPIRLAQDSPTAAAMQWHLNHGAYWTFFVWSILVVCLFNMKVRRSMLANPDRPPSRRAEWSGLLHCFAKPCLIWSALVLLAYLVLTPTTIQTADQLHSARFKQAEESDQIGAFLETECALIRRDPAAEALHRAWAISELGAN